MFSAENLLQYTTDQKGSTMILPIPKGEWVGVIQGDKLKFREEESKKKGREGEKFYVLDIIVQFDDPAVKEATKRENPTSRSGIFVDLTPDGTGLDMSQGKNISLNRLRDVLGQNQEGRPWSPAMLGGQAVKCKIDHEPDKNNPEIVYDRITAFLPL